MNASASRSSSSRAGGDDFIRMCSEIAALSDQDSSKLWRLQMEVERLRNVILWWEDLQARRADKQRIGSCQHLVSRRDS